ncbi:asparagine synthase (glutamine-hydrolyzing) [Amorphus suaedae]
MCGIAGYSGAFVPGLLAGMSEAIAHRGPDADGAFQDEEAGIGLAHRRLAIVDLSSAGSQPMQDDAGRVVIVFNGEIYNFRELRDELIADGYRFRGHSDTEVLLNLYLRDGPDLLARLNGIFAFAIWDRETRRLFLARDHFGVKPLYHTTTPCGFLFASELKALLRESSVSRELDPETVAGHLTFLWAPGPRTMLAGVEKLEPGTAMLVADGRIARRWRFYDLPFGVGKRRTTVEAACAGVRTHIDQAVERQMVADVPVGAFLSGGLDSSAVVASARAFSENRLQCFTIAFGDAGAMAEEGMAEDLPYAEQVATHLDVDLHRVTAGPEMIDSLEEMIFFLDEPQADPAPLNAYFISMLARQNGIKVLLSGAGGDDIFTGYRRHYALQQERLWDWLPRPARSAIAGASSLLPIGSVPLRRLRKGLANAGSDGDGRIASYFAWIDPALAFDLLDADFRAGLEGQSAMAPLRSAVNDLPKGASRLDRMLALECRHFLADHNLNYTDRMSMAHGVEVRVPLLDPDLVAFAASLPDDFKQHGRTGKWIFKKAMEGILPDAVIYRPKTGFGAPLRRWLRQELRPVVGDLLSRDVIRRRGIFDADAVARLVARDHAGRIDAAYTIFALVCIELWCRIFLDQSPPQLQAARSEVSRVIASA